MKMQYDDAWKSLNFEEELLEFYAQCKHQYLGENVCHVKKDFVNITRSFA